VSGWSPSVGSFAAQRENIAYAEGGGAEELGLQRNAVPVATGDLQNGLDAASHQEVRRREAGHVRFRPRAVGHIDRGDEPAQRECVIDEFGGSVDTGGESSAVTTKTPVPQVLLQLAMALLDDCSFVAKSILASPS